MVLDIISLPGKWDHHIRLSAAEHLLMAGVVLPADTVFALVDSVLERIERWGQNQDKYLLQRVVALCPFTDDAVAGIAKIREVLAKERLGGYELRELITALGESRSDAAVDLLHELASDVGAFEHCTDSLINAIATLDTERARELLLGFVDPDIQAIALTRPLHREEVLVARLTQLAQLRPEIAARLLELCEHDLPEFNRHILSKVMYSSGTPEALVANLNLINDAKIPPVPAGVWDQLESAFVARQPYGQNTNAFTLHAQASNELRVRLLLMAREDHRRRSSALRLLLQIEVWRLEYGRPMDEPRHPDLASGQPWPPQDL
jgi:hypothetical protein